jgi:hypothetical protein
MAGRKRAMQLEISSRLCTYRRSLLPTCVTCPRQKYSPTAFPASRQIRTTKDCVSAGGLVSSTVVSSLEDELLIRSCPAEGLTPVPAQLLAPGS